MKDSQPYLSHIIGDAKLEILKTISTINLPAYLMEGIILSILCEIREQKNIELLSDMNRMKQTEHSEQEEKKEGAE